MKKLSPDLLEQMREVRDDMMSINLKVGNGTKFDNADICNALRNLAWGVMMLIQTFEEIGIDFDEEDVPMGNSSFLEGNI